jgi:hypothetical protein
LAPSQRLSFIRMPITHFTFQLEAGERTPR